MKSEIWVHILMYTDYNFHLIVVLDVFNPLEVQCLIHTDNTVNPLIRPPPPLSALLEWGLNEGFTVYLVDSDSEYSNVFQHIHI